MKTGLIVEGGGMKCAYSAGVLDIFLDEDIQFDYCVGVSAGAANAASFLAHQRDRNYRYYTKHVTDKRYLSVYSLLTTGSLFGLRYIYGTMTNEGGGDPLDFDAYHDNPTDAYVVATDGATGKPHYFHKNEIRRNHYEPIMASCALPVVCRPITYEGHTYFDGGCSDSIPVSHALSCGCEKLVILLSKPRDYVMEPQSYRTAYTLLLKRKYPNVVDVLDHRHEMYNAQFALVKKLEQEGKAFVFYAPGDIPIGTYTKDPAIMQQFYDCGVADAKKNVGACKEFLA